MDTATKSAFRAFLQKSLDSEDAFWLIEPQVTVAEEFVTFLQASGRPTSPEAITADDVRAFSENLVERGLNSVISYFALLRYGRFAHNEAISTAVIEILDGQEVLGNLYKHLTAIGEAQRDEIFAGISPHVLGMPQTQLAAITHTILERMERILGVEATKGILAPSLRTLPDEFYEPARKKFTECGGVDAYLEHNGKRVLATLEQLKNEGKLFYTQEITDDVLEFIRRNPEIMNGVREGNVIYTMQVPYQAKLYLAETDERMKRYYYCHCPWARESIRSGKEVSGTFCNCSAGYHKRRWEVIFGQPLRAEVLESVLKGDKRCRFAIYLPEGAV